MIGDPRVSVIVPHYSDLDRLGLCLDALDRQTWPVDRREIIVADNASPEGVAAIEAVIAGRARLVIVRQKGAGPARNGGVAAASGEILAFIDSDCIPQSGWLAAGVAALTHSDFVGGRMTVFPADPPRMTPAEAFEAVFAFDNEGYVKHKGFTVSANLFCSRALFDAVGGFGVGLSEDVDWSNRARAAGFRLGYAPEAVIAHPARRTWAELMKKWRRVNAETYGLFASRPGGKLLWLARGLALPLSALAHTPRVLTRPGLTAPQKCSALVTLYRVRLWRCADAMGLLFHSAAP